MRSSADVLGLFSINVVSLSPNLVLRGLLFSNNVVPMRAALPDIERELPTGMHQATAEIIGQDRLCSQFATTKRK